MTALNRKHDRRSSGCPPEQPARIGPARLIAVGLIGTLAACVVLIGAPSGASAPQTSMTCSPPKGVAGSAAGAKQSPVAVLSVKVRGLSCAKGVSVAREVAGDLATGKAISVTGSTGLDLSSTSTCASCAARTEVSIVYPHGAITLSIRGATMTSSAGIPSTIPGFPFPFGPTMPFPASPFSPSPPSGGVTTV